LLDPALSKIRAAVEAGLERRPFESVMLAAKVIEAVEEGASDAAAQRENAGWAVRFAAETYRNTMSGDLGNAGAERAVCDVAAASLVRCIDAAGQLHQSMPIPLCLAGLFDDLSRISRAGAAAVV
jgi:hypothetical protein